MSVIKFSTPIQTIDERIIVVVPKDASAQLPSRGMVMVEGSYNEQPIQAPLEPDGRGSHWFEIDTDSDLRAGDNVRVEMTPTKHWPEPVVPADIQQAVDADDAVKAVWDDITPMARWDWIRWIRATNNTETRLRRIKVACSKMKAGSRRPCCFNRSACTDPSVSKNGVLLEPTANTLQTIAARSTV